MEAVLDSRWDASLAIPVVLVIGANYIECKRKTKIFSSGDEFPRKLRLLWGLICQTRLLAAPIS